MCVYGSGVLFSRVLPCALRLFSRVLPGALRASLPSAEATRREPPRANNSRTQRSRPRSTLSRPFQNTSPKPSRNLRPPGSDYRSRRALSNHALRSARNVDLGLRTKNGHISGSQNVHFRAAPRAWSGMTGVGNSFKTAGFRLEGKVSVRRCLITVYQLVL